MFHDVHHVLKLRWIPHQYVLSSLKFSLWHDEIKVMVDHHISVSIFEGH